MVLTADPSIESTLGLKFKYSLGSSADAPCVLMVHGRAGNYDVMWTFRRCIPEGVTIIAPQAPIADPIGGFSWWLVRPDWPKEEAVDAAQNLLEFVEKALVHFALRPRNIIALGLYQGGAILSLCIQQAPNKFGGLGMLASFAIKHPAITPALEGMPIFIGHGSKDEVVPLEKAMRGGDYLRESGGHITLVTDEVGHKLGTGAMRELKAWIATVLS
jgi:phospholipase/carboxylesterase